MELYNTLGKGVLSLFIGLASLLSPASSPLPQVIPPPIAVEFIPPPISYLSTSTAATTSIQNNISTSSATSTEAISTKPKIIPIYLNYPEKIIIKPAKTIDQNFKKVFQYSIVPQTQATQTPATPPQQNTPAIIIPTVTTVNREHRIKNSIVNVYCSIQNGRNVKVITGSGVVIDPRGIVLTNAHVGQFPLLQDSSIAQNMDCSIRTGSPVNKTYGVKTLYVSKDWINTHYRNISQINFSETGEADIAILQIVDKATGTATNKTFDYLLLSSSAPSINDQISIASYPADILGINGVNSLLTVQIEHLRVSNVFNFTYSSQPELVETSDSIQAQHGSSGGALLNNQDQLTGIIAITVSGDSPLMKHARALTIPHISAVIQKDTGNSLNSLLSQSTDQISTQFEATKQGLIQRLIDGSAALFFQQ